METRQVNSWNEGPTAVISVGGSPFTFQNTESCPVEVYVSGGTVTTIDIIHNDAGGSAHSAGLLGGQYHLNPGQAIKVVYVLAPTMKYHPV